MDITRNYHQDDLFSVQAYQSIRNHKEVLVRKIVNYIDSLGPRGATSDEVEGYFELPHQTVSARLTEAKASGLLYRNGDKRKTRSGRNAGVLVTRRYL